MTDNSKTQVFISFATQEKKLAEGIQRYIENAFDKSVAVFVSDTTITAGELWENEIRTNIENADLVLVISSTFSIMRPWVNFERGAGSMRGARVIALCHSGLRSTDLKEVWGKLDGEAIDIHDATCGEMIVKAVSEYTEIKASEDKAKLWAESIQGYFIKGDVCQPLEGKGEGQEDEKVPFMLCLEWKELVQKNYEGRNAQSTNNTGSPSRMLHITQRTESVNCPAQCKEEYKGLAQIKRMTNFLKDLKNRSHEDHARAAGVAIGIQNCLFDEKEDEVYVGVRMKASNDYSASQMEIAKAQFNTGYRLLRKQADAVGIFRAKTKTKGTSGDFPNDILCSIEDLQDLFVTMPGLRKQILRPKDMCAGDENDRVYAILSNKLSASGRTLYPVLFDDKQEGVATIFINNSPQFPRFEIGVWKYIVINPGHRERLIKEGMIAGFGQDAFLDYRGAAGIDDFAVNYWIWVKDGEIFYWSYPEERLIDRYTPATPWGDRKHEILVSAEFMEERYGNKVRYTPFVTDDVLAKNPERVLTESFSLPARALLSCF